MWPATSTEMLRVTNIPQNHFRRGRFKIVTGTVAVELPYIFFRQWMYSSYSGGSIMMVACEWRLTRSRPVCIGSMVDAYPASGPPWIAPETGFAANSSACGFERGPLRGPNPSA